MIAACAAEADIMKFRKSFNEEAFLKLLDELKQKLVIVEGRKDKEALKTLGLKRIIAINGKPLIKIVNKIHELNIKETVILTDFDKQGRIIETKLRNLLHTYKIHTNAKLRSKMMRIGKNRIEDFKNFLDLGISEIPIKGSFIGGDDYGEISANFNKIHNKSKNKSKRSNRKTRRNRGSVRSN